MAHVLKLSIIFFLFLSFYATFVCGMEMPSQGLAECVVDPFDLLATKEESRLRELIEAGCVEVNSCSRQLCTLLHFSVAYGCGAILDTLISAKGIMLDAQNGLGDTPLHVAALMNNTDAIAKLFAAGATLDMQNVVGYTPLRVAVEWDNREAIKKLLEFGASACLKDYFGQSSFELACQKCCPTIVQLFEVHMSQH